MGFRVLVSRHPAIQTTGLLTLAPAGLSPAEHTSLHWTHNRACRFPALGFPIGFTTRLTMVGRFMLVSSDDTRHVTYLRLAI